MLNKKRSFSYCNFHPSFFFFPLEGEYEKRRRVSLSVSSWKRNARAREKLIKHTRTRMCYVCNFPPTVCVSGEITHISRRKGGRLICNSRISRLKIARSPRRFPRRAAAAAAPSFEDDAISPSLPLRHFLKLPRQISAISSEYSQFLILHGEIEFENLSNIEIITGDGIYFRRGVIFIMENNGISLNYRGLFVSLICLRDIRIEKDWTIFEEQSKQQCWRIEKITLSINPNVRYLFMFMIITKGNRYIIKMSKISLKTSRNCHSYSLRRI